MFQVLKLEKSYRRLLTAGLINGVGDRFSQVALLALILQMTGSGLSVGITMALRLLPFLFFGPFSSVVAEKISRKKLMIITDFARALVALSFLFIDSEADLWIAYVGSFLLASGEALYSPARKSSIPAIVERIHLKQVNSWEQVMLGFVLIIGAFTGGVVSYIFGAQAAFLVNVASFILAGWIISGIDSLESKGNVHDSGKEQSVASLKPLKTKFFPTVLISSFLLMLISFEMVVASINGIENVLLSVYAVETFKAGDLGVGILYSVLGTGFVISPLITKYINRHFLAIAFVCIALEGVFLSIISQTGSFAIVVVLFGTLTIFGGVGNTLLDTVAMETIPSKLHGAYFSFSATIANTCIGLSMFMTGVLLEFFTPRQMGLAGGLLYIGCGAVFFFWAMRMNVGKERENLAERAVG
ncbi:MULTISPECIES: MFS transporter [unclassified Bacillus (in: firmicutes)]|uniref:MFS transporter n=1 Tax=unclassified Bacillus (in: firmicutes) TaxID=185979 RepID=UPI0015870579|nr:MULTISPECIES: MFS transporter [unclassified Bacillus (in: firmicutes)]